MHVMNCINFDLRFMLPTPCGIRLPKSCFCCYYQRETVEDCSYDMLIKLNASYILDTISGDPHRKG